MPDRGLGAGTDHGSEAPGCLGVGSGPGLEVPVPGAGSGSGPHWYRRPWSGVRETPGDRAEAQCGLFLRYSLPFLGTGPERAPQRPGAPVLPEKNGLPPGDPRAGTGGGGSAPPSTSEGPGGSHPGGGLCPWVGSPRTRPTVLHRTRHSGPSGDSPERLRSASRSGARPCLGRWLRSGSPAVEMAAIGGRKEALAARIFGSPPRSLPLGYALIPGSRRGCTSDWIRGFNLPTDMAIKFKIIFFRELL